MLKTVIAACALLCALDIAAEARGRRALATAPECNRSMPCDFSFGSQGQLREAARVARGRYVARQIGIGGVAPRRAWRKPQHSTSSSDITAPLAAKVAEIESACGSRVISGVRHTYIAGTRHISLHASGKAVDLSGNSICIYAHLGNWPGGYSTDAARMGHVHISYDPDGGREWGLHFRHGGHRYARHGGGHRYAHRHHRLHRIASR